MDESAGRTISKNLEFVKKFMADRKYTEPYAQKAQIMALVVIAEELARLNTNLNNLLTREGDLFG